MHFICRLKFYILSFFCKFIWIFFVVLQSGGEKDKSDEVVSRFNQSSADQQVDDSESASENGELDYKKVIILLYLFSDYVGVEAVNPMDRIFSYYIYLFCPTTHNESFYVSRLILWMAGIRS